MPFAQTPSFANAQRILLYLIVPSASNLQRWRGRHKPLQRCSLPTDRCERPTSSRVLWFRRPFLSLSRKTLFASHPFQSTRWTGSTFLDNVTSVLTKSMCCSGSSLEEGFILTLHRPQLTQPLRKLDRQASTHLAEAPTAIYCKPNK